METELSDDAKAELHAARAVLERVSIRRPDVHLLAALASLAVRIDTALLRRLRRRLSPALAESHSPGPRLTAATEGRLWSSRLVDARGPRGFTLDTALAQQLRTWLRSAPTRCLIRADGTYGPPGPSSVDERASISLFEAARLITHARHPTLPPEMQWEERVLWRLTVNDGQMDAVLAEPLGVLLSPDRENDARRATAAWVHGALARMPARLWTQPAAWVVGLAATHAMSRSEAAVPAMPASGVRLVAAGLRNWRPPPTLGEPTGTLSALAPRREVSIGIERQGRWLMLHPNGETQPLTLSVPATSPRLVEVAAGSKRWLAQVPAEGEPISVEVGPDKVEVWALNGRLMRVPAPRRPPIQRPSTDGDGLIFISYAGPDVHHAEALARALQPHGHPTFVDTLPLSPGDTWDTAITDALRRAAMIVVLVSAQWQVGDRWYARDEVARAIARGGNTRVVPAIIGSVSALDMPSGLARFIPLRDADRDWHATAATLSQIIRGETYGSQPGDRTGRGVRVSLSLLPSGGRFFEGREDELAHLDRAWSDPTVGVQAIIGVGGEGKSALVKCWLNRMKRDDYRGAARVYGWSFVPTRRDLSGQPSP